MACFPEINFFFVVFEIDLLFYTTAIKYKSKLMITLSD